MRRLGAWGFEAALLVGLTMTVSAAAADLADDDLKAVPKDKDSPGWLSTWFGGGKKEPAGKPPATRDKDKDKDKETDKKRPPGPAHPSELQDVAGRLNREQAALLRRLSVCDQLRRVAEKNDDDQLRRQTEQLEKQAWQVYSQHVGSLPGGLAHFESDEAVLERHLGAGASRRGAGKDETPAQARNAKARAGRDAGEDQP